MHDAEPDARALLEFEGRWYRHRGAKEQAIRDELGLGAVRYYQLLVGIVRNPPPELAVEFGPLINRLRGRLRAA